LHGQRRAKATKPSSTASTGGIACTSQSDADSPNAVVNAFVTQNRATTRGTLLVAKTAPDHLGRFGAAWRAVVVDASAREVTAADLGTGLSEPAVLRAWQTGQLISRKGQSATRSARQLSGLGGRHRTTRSSQMVRASIW
jgi:hypothetical protein